MTTDNTALRDRAHVVVLGASNVTLGFPRIVAEIRRLFRGPVQIFAAHGHGRSYGTGGSWAPFRWLPGVLKCGLWEAFEKLREGPGEEIPVYGLATDIGNDLLFGASPEQIDEWLAECLGRLNGFGATLTVGRPPVFALQRLGKTRYRTTRSFFFPKSPLTYERMLVDVPRLDDLIERRAATAGATTFTPRPEWYGFDPIHIRRACRPAAWREIVGQWKTAEEDLGAGPRAEWRHWLLKPAVKFVKRQPRMTEQPALRWADGSGIWLF